MFSVCFIPRFKCLTQRMFVGLTDVTPFYKASPQVPTAKPEKMTKENFLPNPDCAIHVVPMADNDPANHINYFDFRVLIAFGARFLHYFTTYIKLCFPYFSLVCGFCGA